MTVLDKIDPGRPIALSEPVGDPQDANSRIFPFKVHRGKPPYDKVNKTMTIIHLFPKGKDDTAAFWKGYNWEKALQFGMDYVGLTWLIAFAFFVFWLFTTGEWKQYLHTTKKMFEVVRYYSYGIFRGESHPVPKRKEAKHNPLQRLTYLSLAAFLLPVQMISGFLYWGYNDWADWGFGFLALEVIAVIHTIGAFAILSFLIVHLYMTTTGHSVTAHIRAMITGWEEVEKETEVEDWERALQKEGVST